VEEISMTGTLNPEQRDIVTEPDTSRAWWFLGTLAVLRNPEGAPRTPAVIELTVPPGGSPPRHVHDELDDSFLVLDGEVVVRCGEQTIIGRPGTYVCVPTGVEHTFRVTSPEPARMLQVHNDDSFLNLIEAVGTPTRELRLPPSGEFDVDLDTLARLNAEHDSRIVGPSLGEDEARSYLDGDGARPRLGAFNHVALLVSDVRRSERWYAETFGLVRVDGEVADDGSGHIALLCPDGGWILSLAGPAMPRVEHVAITCRNRDELCRWHDDLATAGAGSITEAPYGSGFVLRDPDGLQVELFTPAPT
jgi:quercetin dioxygenase-like cupin family protein/catechol 2,3-dioxygenase-like lactoylglutathione lyase family enzyme